jgi:hypothetical protein
MSNLTLLSVISYDYKYFEINYQLTSKLNKLDSFKWIVVQNKSHFDQGNIFKKNKKIKKIKNKNLKYIKGVDQKKKLVKTIKKDGNSYNLENDRSLYHARGLKIGLNSVKTRYLLIIDPDAYVIEKNWCEKLINYMKDNNLSFMGAPYHLRDFEKIRNFPTTYFLLIDLNKINIKTLNFMPPAKKYFTKEKDKKVIISDYGIIKNLLRMYAYLVGKITKDHQRYYIGSIGDTSYSFYKNFSKLNLRYKLLKPVVKKKDFTLSKRILDKFFPDFLSYIPNDKNLYSENGFIEHKFPDFHSLRCQEFMFDEKPFLVHLRGSIKTFDNNIKMLKRLLNLI